MIPNFALALSFEGIALLRRTGPNWARIDEVPIDHDDLDARVVSMRDRAEMLDPDGGKVAVVIPNEQIRYLDLPDTGGDDSPRDAAIRAALEGTTPYAVDDLVYDHAQAGGRLQIAAVARETLDEAEDFARDHGFTPVCHLAQAPDDSFDGAVYFGTASDWDGLVFRPARAITVVHASPEALEPRVPTPDVAPPVQPVTEPDAEHAPEPDETVVAGAAADEALPSGETAPDDAEAQAEITAREGPAEPGTPQAADADAAEPAPAQKPLPPAAPPLAAAYEPHLIASLPPLSPPEGSAAPEEPDLEAARLKPLPEAPRPDGFAYGPAAGDLAPKAEPAGMPAPSTATEDAGAAEDVAPTRPTPGASPKPAHAPAPEVTEPPGNARPRFTPVFSKSDIARDAGITSDHIDDEPDIADSALPVVFSHAAPEPIAPASPPVAAPAKTVDDPAQAARAPVTAPKLGAARKPDDATPMPKAVAAPAATADEKAAGGADKGKGLGAKLVGRGAGLLRPKASVAEAADPVDAGPAVSSDGAPAGLTADKTTDLPPAAPATPPPGTQAANPLARIAALRAGAQPVPPSEQPANSGRNLPAFSTAAPSDAATAVAADAAKFGASDERERMTVFGARAKPGRQIGGKPRFLGLMLTSGLLMFLAGIAAWASVFSDDGIARFFRSEAPATAIAALPGVEETTVIPVDEPPAVPDITIEINPEADSDSGPVEVAALETPAPATDAIPAPALSQPVIPRTLTPEEAEATYAATGIWQRTPNAPLTPPTDGVDEVYRASIDPDIRIFDAVALPDLPGTVGEPVLADPGLPPPAGVTFDIDARGVVRATPEGAMTPDGLRVYAGLPPAVPPLRNPAPVAPALPDAAPATPTVGAAPEAVPPAETSPLSTFRPEARPTDIVEQRERATLQGISLGELQAFRPQARPRTAQETAAIEEPEATDLAVRSSLVPVTRPRSMAAIVRRAEETRPPEPVQTAAVAPRTVQPNLPSRANVARAATVRNAIALNKVSLIGVYGTPSNRRALVRLASGKYVKVQVGDRLDGGRVAAIGEGELRYTKRGRNLTIQMPRG